MRTPERVHPAANHGAVLAVCLLLLTMLTLIAVAGLRAAALELRSSGSAIYQEQAFELALTGLGQTIALINDGRLQLADTADWSRAAITHADAKTGHVYDTTIRFLYRGPPPQSYVRLQPGATQILFYEITATGSTRLPGAKSVQTRGLWIPALDERPVRPTYWYEHAQP